MSSRGLATGDWRGHFFQYRGTRLVRCYLVPEVTELGLNSWEDMNQVLERVLWVQTINELKFRRLWEEVQSAREYPAEQGDLSTTIYSAEHYLDDHENEEPSSAQYGL